MCGDERLPLKTNMLQIHDYRDYININNIVLNLANNLIHENQYFVNNKDICSCTIK